jgi:tetratricopeptide (TPR) repeat protein
MVSTPAASAERAASPLPLRISLALSAALLFWSFVGGALYLITIQRRFPLGVDALDEAHWRLGRGDTKGALKEYRRFTSMSPFETRAQSEMGRLLLREGQLNEAAAAFEGVLRLQPRDLGALVGLGDVRLAQARGAEASSLYESALSQVPRSATLHKKAARAHALSGELDQAIAEFDAALALGPDPEASAGRERALAEKQRAAESGLVRR